MDILLVEDDPTDRKLLSAVLSSSGHRVLQHGSAEAALEEIRRSQPELILLDLSLPGMDGLELTRMLKQDPETRHIPIVAVTAARELFSQSDALAAGCDAYVVKPIDTRRLSDQLESAVAKGSSRTKQ